MTFESSNRTLALIVEDDRPVRTFITATLGAHGFDTLVAETGTEGVTLAYRRVPDVILLDMGLPDIDGMDVLTRIRAGLDVPIIIVSARDNERAKVSALDAGADDYLNKPFGTGELLARIRVSLRHAQRARQTSVSHHPSETVEIGRLLFDHERRCVSIEGTPVHLTPIEFRLLDELVVHRGKVLTHAHLVDRVWGPGQHVDRHNVRVFMATLRRKLERNMDGVRLIETEVGVGYRLRDS